MDWVPIVFVTFKLLVFGTGMFFAIKCHFDQDKKEASKRVVLRATGSVTAVLLLFLLGVGLFGFILVRMLGLDMTLP